MNSSGYVKTKRGNVFQPSTGKLFIFDDNSVSVLRGWPVMRAWKKTCVKHPNWIGFRPSLSWLELELRENGEQKEIYRRTIEAGQQELPFEYRYRNEGNPYGSDVSQWYFETTPREIRDLLKPFGNSRWALMSFLAVGGTPAQELLQSAPALAFMLANNRVFHSPKVARPLRAIRDWLKPGKKRKELAGWLGFPPVQSSVHLLAKIPAEDLSIALLLQVRQLIKNPVYEKMLRHLQSVDRAALCFFDSGMGDYLSPAFLMQLQRILIAHLPYDFREKYHRTETEIPDKFAVYKRYWKKEEQYVWGLLSEVAQWVQKLHPGEPLPKIRNAWELLVKHRQLEREDAYLAYKGIEFQAPFVGNADIIPITDITMLCEEGEKQHNCVASYAQDIADGDSFIYRVLAPERCTLEIAKKDGVWHINQLLATCNEEPQWETTQAVLKWLKDNQTQQ